MGIAAVVGFDLADGGEQVPGDPGFLSVFAVQLEVVRGDRVAGLAGGLRLRLAGGGVLEVEHGSSADQHCHEQEKTSNARCECDVDRAAVAALTGRWHGTCSRSRRHLRMRARRR